MSNKESTDSSVSSQGLSKQLEPALEHIRQALLGLQYGQVSVTVQYGVIVQMERVERKRFRRSER
jgi:hypothetical protein